MKWDRFNSWKVLKYSDKLQLIADGKMPYPLVWHIYCTNECNMRCNFCIMKDEKHLHKGSLTLDLMEKAIDDAIVTNAELIHLSGGGEPFLNPNTVKAIEYNAIKSNPVKIAVSTNGVHIPVEIVSKVNHIRISLNAGNAFTHKRIMNARLGDFKRICDKVHDLVRIKKSLDDDMYHDIGLSFLITPDNWTEIYDFAAQANNLEVDFIHVRPCFYPRHDARNIELMDIVTNKLGVIRDSVLRDFGNKMQIGFVTEKFEGYWSLRDYGACRSTPLQCVLTATGEFVVCQDVFIRFGNYYKQSFDEIWNSKEHQDAINKIQLSKCPRCVETRHNQIIEHFFLHNDVRSELL